MATESKQHKMEELKLQTIYTLDKETGELIEHHGYWELLCHIASEMNLNRDQVSGQIKAPIKRPALQFEDSEYEEALKEQYINDWDFNFIDQMKSKKFITEKQRGILERIETKVSWVRIIEQEEN